jgi:hypothetical protein
MKELILISGVVEILLKSKFGVMVIPERFVPGKMDTYAGGGNNSPEDGESRYDYLRRVGSREAPIRDL